MIAQVKAGILKVNDAQTKLGYKPDDTQDGYLRNTLTSEMVKSGEEPKPPARIEAETDRVEVVDDGEKDYPDFMQQIDRVAIAADER